MSVKETEKQTVLEETQAKAAAARRSRIERTLERTWHSLDARQRIATLEFLCGASKTEALTTAGYSNPNSQATRVFNGRKVQAVIDQFFHLQEMTAKQWVQRMSEQAQAVYTNYFYWDADEGELAIDIEQMLADGYGYLIKDVSYRGKDADRQVVHFQPSFDAQMAIAKYLGLFKDVAVNLEADLSSMTDEELDELIKRL